MKKLVILLSLYLPVIAVASDFANTSEEFQTIAALRDTVFEKLKALEFHDALHTYQPQLALFAQSRTNPTSKQFQKLQAIHEALYSKVHRALPGLKQKFPELCQSLRNAFEVQPELEPLLSTSGMPTSEELEKLKIFYQGLSKTLYQAAQTLEQQLPAMHQQLINAFQTHAHPVLKSFISMYALAFKKQAEQQLQHEINVATQQARAIAQKNPVQALKNKAQSEHLIKQIRDQLTTLASLDETTVLHSPFLVPALEVAATQEAAWLRDAIAYKNFKSPYADFFRQGPLTGWSLSKEFLQKSSSDQNEEYIQRKQGLYTICKVLTDVLPNASVAKTIESKEDEEL